jgi:2-methylisocitrate lyase-like PEP mutase family enzyme
MATTRQLRQLLNSPGVIRSLGAHDVLTARLIEAAGLETVFLGGFGTSANLLGLPDVGLITLTEMAGAVRRMALRVGIPVVADGDTGHGDLHNVVRTVREFERAGAAGVLLEDQVTPKRCGHFAGKQVIPADEMVLKLHAALGARTDPDFVIVARTDARAVEGIDGAIERANRYGAAGADVCFIEAPESRKELEDATVHGRMVTKVQPGRNFGDEVRVAVERDHRLLSSSPTPYRALTASARRRPLRTPGSGQWREIPVPARRRTHTSEAPGVMRRCWSPRERTAGGWGLRATTVPRLGRRSPCSIAPG